MNEENVKQNNNSDVNQTNIVPDEGGTKDLQDSKIGVGKVVSVRGVIAEVEFREDPRPKVNDVLFLQRDKEIRLQVVRSSAKNRFYCMKLANINESLCRGDVVFNSGESLKIPVGRGILGRVMDVYGNPKDGLGEIKFDELREIFNEAPSYSDTVSNLEFLETGIKIVDLFAPLVKGGKVGLLGGSGVGKTMLLTEILNNIINKDREKTVSVFCGVGERSREGQELVDELKESGVLPSVALVFGAMGESPSVRYLTAHAGVTVSEYLRDDLGKDVLFFIDNIFRYAQAGNELSLLMNNIPSESGYQATLTSEIASIHERLVANKGHSITSIEAIYLPEDDIFDQAAQSVFGYLDSSIVLSRQAYREGRLPAVDIIQSDSDVLNPTNISPKHYYVATAAKSLLKRSEQLERIVSLVGESELSEEDRVSYQRAKKIKNFMTQNFFVAEAQTAKEGVYVKVDDTVNCVKDILDGKYDDVSEDKFLYIGSLDEITK